MSDQAVGCKKCRAFINISTSTGGVGAVELWNFIIKHSHRQNMKGFMNSSVNTLEFSGFKEEK